VNCAQTLDSGVPFGGYKQSGIGRELGEYALDTFVFVFFSFQSVRDLYMMAFFFPDILRSKLFISILDRSCERMTEIIIDVTPV
jgi:acyl-CoA reductase-like NAD-dependent aldehyde dehydrogenase